MMMRPKNKETFAASVSNPFTKDIFLLSYLICRAAYRIELKEVPISRPSFKHRLILSIKVGQKKLPNRKDYLFRHYTV
ncbi:hypothetical protein TNCV_3375721 [Trichonephila clavipes]|nr:hypothetical protein TNCV_3375721 [Trichonephila clavipes]